MMKKLSVECTDFPYISDYSDVESYRIVSNDSLEISNFSDDGEITQIYAPGYWKRLNIYMQTDKDREPQ